MPGAERLNDRGDLVRVGDGDLRASNSLLNPLTGDLKLAIRRCFPVRAIPIPTRSHVGLERGLMLQNVPVIAREDDGATCFRSELE